MSKKWLISVMATAMVFTLGLGAGCFNSGSNSSSSSDPIQSSSSTTDENEATLSLDKRTASVSEYETLKLTATAANGEGDVTWTSSDDKIATVDANGVVTGVKAGTATITASYSGLSVTCTVTVVKAQAPEMSVSAANVSLDKGDTKSVTVSTTVNGKEVAGVEYSWWLEDENKENSDIASIEVSADTKTATFTGLKQGTEKYQVYANVHGQDLFQTVTVKVVDNDITFSVANLDKGAEAYEAELSLATGEGLIQSIKPEISVYYKQQLQDNVTLTFTTNTPEVAEISEDGTITAKTEGVATFTADVELNGSLATLVLRINVIRPEFQIADVTIETGRTDKTLALGEGVNIQGTVNKVLLSNTDVLGSYEDGKITLDAAKVPYKTADLGEGKSLVIETEKAKYVAKADLYTLVLKTKEDFKLMSDVAYAADDHLMRWGGHYVLGNDIDMELTGIDGLFSYARLNEIKEENNIYYGGSDNPYGDFEHDSRKVGFFGIFDGKGYSINNLRTNYWGGGIFVLLGQDAVVKNVAFNDVVLCGKAGIIADAAAGTIENVYVRVKEASGDDDVVFNKNDAFGCFRLNNCFVEFTDGAHVSEVVVAKAHQGYGTVNNVYTVGANAGISWLSGSGDDVFGYYDSYANLAANVDFTAWAESGFWDVSKGVPLPKNMDTSAWGNTNYTVESTSVSINSEVAIKGKYVRIELSDEAVAAGITMKGNTIIIPNDDTLEGKSFKVKAFNFFNDEQFEEITFSLVGTSYITAGNVDAPYEVDLNATATIDLSDVKDQIASNLVNAKFGNVTVTDKVSYADGQLTADLSNVNLYGKQTLTLTFNVTNEEGAVTSVQQVSVPVKAYRVITTKAQLENLANYMQMDGVTAYADIRLGADIDMEGARAGVGTWADAWTHKFTGTFDGKGYTISNTTQGQNQGFFCCIAESGVVKNVIFKNATIASNGGFVATENNGTIENVFVQGSITNVGDGANWAPTSLLASKHQKSATINNCVVILESSTMDGGHNAMLAGWSQATITNSIAINLSGKQVFGVGKQNNTNAEAGADLISSGNTAVTSYKAYLDVKADLAIGESAENFIKSVMATYESVSLGKTEISLGDTAQIVEKKAGFVQGYALKTAVDGVSVDENGLITVANTAVANVDFTVVVTFVDGTTQELNLKTALKATSKDIATLGDVDVREVTTVSHDFASDVAAGATIKHVYVNDNEVEFTSEGTKVNVAIDAFNFGENKVQVIFETASERINVNTSLVKASIIISNAEEFIAMRDVFEANHNAPANAANKNKSYYAYVLLDADIDMTDHTWNAYWNWTDERDKTGGWNQRAGGFLGTFDGRGHYVANLTVGDSFGLFGIMNTVSVVKNVAFVNTNIPAGRSLFASQANGTIENVYVEIQQANHGAAPNGWGIANVNCDAYGEVRWKNVFVQVNGVADNYATSQEGRNMILGTAHNGYNAYSNVLVVSNGANVYHAASTGNAAYGAGELQSYTTRADMAAADDWSIEGWSSIWTTDADGLPIFVSAKEMYKPTITNKVTTVSAGSTYQVNVTCPSAVTYSVDNADCSIDANGLLSIGASVANETEVTVTVKSVISGYEATIKLTVANIKNVTIETTTDVDVTKEAVLDLGDANLTSLTNATWNDQVLAVSLNSDGKLVVPANTFGTGKTDWGNLTLSVLGADANGATVVVSVPVYAYVGVTSANLSEVGYHDGFGVYGEFRLLNDVDATGWTGNGTWVNNDWNFILMGTFDGQGHVISNYTGETNVGLFCRNEGTIKNLVVKNATITGCSGVVVSDNQGTVENVVVEATLNGTGATWCPTAGIVAKNLYANAVIKNCIAIYVGGNGGTAGVYQGIIAGYNWEATIENCIAINLTSNTVHGIGTWNVDLANSTDATSGTNKTYVSTEFIEDRDNITTDDWATEYLKKIVDKYLTISGPAAAAIGGSAQYTVANKGFGCTWTLTEEIAGVSIGEDGILTIGAGVTADTVTIKATNVFGQSKTFQVSITQSMIDSTFTNFEYDASKGNATIDLSSLSESELTLVKVTIGGSDVEATISEGVVTIANDKLALGPTANSVVITVSDGTNAYRASGEITKVSLIIKTADDIDNWGSIADAADSDTKYWGGYFVLANDIDYTGHSYNPFITYSIVNDRGGKNGFDSGFRGVFDGRGHIIDHFTMNAWAGGFFGYTISTCTVKNLSFTNAKLSGGTAFIGGAGGNNGTFENIYIQTEMSNGNPDNGDKTGFFPDMYGGMRANNVYIDVTMTEEANAGVKGLSYHKAFENMQGVYMTGVPSAYAIVPCGCCESMAVNIIDAWDDRAGMKEDTGWLDEFDTWDMSFWTTDADGLPIPVAVKNIPQG